MRKLGWSDRSRPVLHLLDDPRFLTSALLVARELGDDTTEQRLRAFAESHWEPRFFGDDGQHFGWWFGYEEEWPRGQTSALMVLSEIGGPGSWLRVFEGIGDERFAEPTVEGVDFPALGIARACNDRAEGALWVETYAATPARRGEPTTFRVTGLPDPAALAVSCDGAELTRWRAVGEDAVEVAIDVGDHVLRIETGYTGGSRAHRTPPTPAVAGAPATGPRLTSPTASGATATCSCCAPRRRAA